MKASGIQKPRLGMVVDLAFQGTSNKGFCKGCIYMESDYYCSRLDEWRKRARGISPRIIPLDVRYCSEYTSEEVGYICCSECEDKEIDRLILQEKKAAVGLFADAIVNQLGNRVFDDLRQS